MGSVSSAFMRSVGSGSQERECNLEAANPVKPERNLIAAVLARAICDAFGTAQCEGQHRRTAKQWIFGKLAPKKPFSFAWCSNALDLDPTDLQTALLEHSSQPEKIAQKIALLR